MRMFLGHPDFPQYGFYLMCPSKELEQKIERLGPVKFISKSYDWPPHNSGFRQWTDKLNSLWWPTGGDCFSTCVILIDDPQRLQFNQSIEHQRQQYNKLTTWRYPYLILSARMSPEEGQQPDGTFTYPAEDYPPTKVDAVDKETALVEWKLYPLPPVNLTSTTGIDDFAGLWLLPLVDIRYLYRNVPLNQLPGGSSSSSGCGINLYPFISVDKDDQFPGWFPPIRGYPDDTNVPQNYTPISGQGTSSEISGATRWGEAVEEQAELYNVRIVCRDVRSNFNVEKGKTPHKSFTGVIADYPEDWSNPLVQSYHLDATKIFSDPNSRVAGGLSDTQTLDDMIARKLQCLFRVRGTETWYSVTIATNVDYPTVDAHLSVDADGPDACESKIIPAVFFGIDVSTRYPDVVERAGLITAAKQWCLLYYAWRTGQAYFRLPGIHPLIPNGHAHTIRWDFQPGNFYTSYVALEGVQGSSLRHAARREPFYARIDGEGAIQDGLHGVYAFTEVLDTNGQLTTHPNPRIGYVHGVNGQQTTLNPARDETGKVAVPVGMIVWMKPGVPYLDVATCKVFDHYLFTTGDLLQVIKIKSNLELNKYGHLGAVIMRWNPDIVGFVESSDIWSIVLQ